MVIRYLVLACAVFAIAVGEDGFCYPGMNCWPSLHAIEVYQWSLDGKLIFPLDDNYYNLTVMHNVRTTRFPYMIALVKTTADVVKSVKFAVKHNIKLTVRSSGHDYIGRSTADGSLQINLQNMTDLKIYPESTFNPAGIVKAGSGNQWIRVYTECHKYNRSIVGGSAHTVSMGGYTLGGGHAPIGRKFGMAVDNLLWVTMVTTNGSVVYVDGNGTTLTDGDTGAIINHSSNKDLFWAIRGGGGGTFGIVTEFVYKLHYDSKMVQMSCVRGLELLGHGDVGRSFLQSFNNLLGSTLAPEWGGYEIISGGFNPKTSENGQAFLYLNHYGEWGSASFNTIKPFLDANRLHCSLKNISSFLDYEKSAYDPPSYNSYIFNVLMQPDSFTDGFYDYVYQLVNGHHNVSGAAGCTGVLIGGNMHNVAPDSTAVNPSFRSAVMSLTCGFSWDFNEHDEDNHVMYAEQLTARLLKFGKGTYFNEPSAYLPDWKMAYWGGHYDKLLRIKQEWDPNNVLTCLHCVASDVKRPSAAIVG